VDGAGDVRAVTETVAATRLYAAALPDVHRYFVVKGSVCIARVSRAVNGIGVAGVHVGIVPHTLEVTHLTALRPGDGVNLEADILAKDVERRLGARTSGVDFPPRRAAGFTRE